MTAGWKSAAILAAADLDRDGSAEIIADGFEAGAAARWSAVVP